MQKSVGIVLSTLSLKESDQILTLFSPEGLLKIFVKRRRLTLATLLTEGEFVFELGRGDLVRFRDGTILDQHLSLRERLESLEVAGELTQAVLRSQWQGKSSPRLYALFRHLLQKIPHIEAPQKLVSLFLLKVLRHEGELQLSGGCSVCGSAPTHRYGGERFCSLDAPRGSLEVSDEEEKRLEHLAQTRSLESVEELPLAQALFNQVFG